MTRFLVIYYAPMSATDQMASMTPEAMQKSMEKWMAWAQKCGSALVDMGSPLGAGQRLTKAGVSASDRNATGYSILQAEDMEGAKALLEGHPHLDDAADSAIEVHECLPTPM